MRMRNAKEYEFIHNIQSDAVVKKILKVYSCQQKVDSSPQLLAAEYKDRYEIDFFILLLINLFLVINRSYAP